MGTEFLLYQALSTHNHAPDGWFCRFSTIADAVSEQTVHFSPEGPS